MCSPIPAALLETNPYESLPSLSSTEAEVLWEYAKLSQLLKDTVAETRRLSESPDASLLPRLRVLERKMGLVLTLFKASVWAVINEQPHFEDPGEGESYGGDLTVQPS